MTIVAILAEALAEAVVDKATDVAEDFIDKNTKKSSAEDHRKGLDTDATNYCTSR